MHVRLGIYVLEEQKHWASVGEEHYRKRRQKCLIGDSQRSAKPRVSRGRWRALAFVTKAGIDAADTTNLNGHGSQ